MPHEPATPDRGRDMTSEEHARLRNAVHGDGEQLAVPGTATKAKAGKKVMGDSGSLMVPGKKGKTSKDSSGFSGA